MKSKPERIGFCVKCSHKITTPGKTMVVNGREVKCSLLTGCDICDDPQQGRNCPLIKDEKK